MFFRFIKWFLVVWVLFVAVSIAGGGGEQFRSFQEKAGGLTGRITELLAAKADSLKEEADCVVEFVKNLTGKKHELAKTVF